MNRETRTKLKLVAFDVAMGILFGMVVYEPCAVMGVEKPLVPAAVAGGGAALWLIFFQGAYLKG